VARAIADAAGDTVIEQFSNNSSMLGQQGLICTMAGKLNPPIQRIIHVVEPVVSESPLTRKSIQQQQTLKETVYNCLVGTKALGMKSLTLPAVTHKDKSLGPWETAQAMVDAVCQFDVEMKERSNDERHLTSIEFINLTLDIADVTSFVFRGIFKVANIQRDGEIEDKPEGDIDAQPRLTGDWFDITGLLKHRRKRGKDEYLVQWKDSNEKTWQKREDITEAAIKTKQRKIFQHIQSTK
jgi:O-acetyl-ADP-ribose deacetylase (regulator of RNase III)